MCRALFLCECRRDGRLCNVHLQPGKAQLQLQLLPRLVKVQDTCFSAHCHKSMSGYPGIPCAAHAFARQGT